MFVLCNCNVFIVRQLVFSMIGRVQGVMGWVEAKGLEGWTTLLLKLECFKEPDTKSGPN
jgi:hypothetical protein